jgi:hypothetical protein
MPAVAHLATAVVLDAACGVTGHHDAAILLQPQAAGPVLQLHLSSALHPAITAQPQSSNRTAHVIQLLRTHFCTP